jgi:AsmA-like protein
MAFNKKKLLKILIISTVVIVLLITAGITLVFLNLNSIARKGIEESLAFVLQVDVSLKKVDISIFSGKCSLHDLVIGNPEGFKSKESFSVEIIEVELDLKSFKTDEPVIHRIYIKEPHITLEQKLKKSNFSEMIKNASRFDTGEAEESEETKKSEMNIRIDQVIMDRSKVSVMAPIINRPISLRIPKYTIKDIGGKKEPVTIAESIKIVFTGLFKKILEDGKGIIPDDISGMLKNSLGSVTEQLGKAFEGIKDQTGTVGKTLKDGGKDIGTNVKDAAKGVTDGITGLFKKKKSDD